MNEKIEHLIQQLVPFLIAGIAIALVIGLFIMFSYVLVWGLIIGAILWVASFIKNLLFSSKEIENPKKGRVIEHNDKD
ncbi:hypothetical protein [Legionella jamestowniensis]|uniref:Transmembrane protein n=1 Tax=Legionella jamestowniensis TaxID=455 RepID=A0A0W0UI62_9GAMM|nr:hypothetical protein [Legionella jamestowniensis]KTD07404.1 hypothetical protein Ljam_1599 [Legionella jamestowniensis]OCH97824.1 hypothetical protein A8135_00960 [Legionella jamestowniensis]SFL93446.1 hypothetical protein SAMN02746073_2612 [Legionella jamestowniensis DSM 19215]